MSGIETVADRLREAGLGADRFNEVLDGEKKSVDHEQHATGAVSGNYGIYANHTDRLAILDVDDYGDVEDKSGISALSRLPPTFEQSSPHGGTHRLYAVEPSDDGRLVAAALDDAFGTANPAPSWGEMVVANKYVVGAGSQLDGCDKEWCEACAKPDEGYYSIQADREIATIGVDELIDALEADPDMSAVNETGADLDDFSSDRSERHVPDDVDERLEYARECDEKLDRLLRGNYREYNGDRSKAEYVLAYKLAFWLGGDKTAVENVLEHEAKAPKWTERTDDSYRDSILSAVDDQSEFYQPRHEATDDSYAPDLDMDEVERGQAILAAQQGITDPYGELCHQNGHYGYRKTRTDDDGNEYSDFQSVCNFTLELDHVIATYEGQLLTLTVHPASPMEESYQVQVHPTVFNSPTTFSEEIVRGRTTYFNPQQSATDTLNDLRLTVGHQPAPEHVGTEYIGLHGDDWGEWVTPAGTLRADGWTAEPTHKYYEKGGNDEMESSLVDKWQLDPSDGADYDEATVQAILERVPAIRKPGRGLPILGWFYAAPLKPIIHAIEGEFNLLQVTGDTEAGKTSTLQLFYQLFGADPAPFGCGDTNFTIEKKFAGSCGLPIWLDEYKPTDLGERKLNWLHRRLREVTREKSVSKGQQDLGEITFKMRAPVVFSGEQTVTEAAVRRRAVMTHLTDQATTGRHQEAFCELSGASYTDDDGVEHYPSGHDLHEHARAYYRHILSKDDDELTGAWKEARKKTREHLRALDVPDLDGSEFQGLQTIVFGVGVFRQFADAMGVPQAAPEDGDVRAALAHVISNIGPEGRRREHIDEFVELLNQAAANGYLEEGVSHRVYQPQLTDGEDALAFHMPTAFSAVKKYVREFNIEEEYSLLGKNDYIDSLRDKADRGESYPVEVNHRVRGIENGAKAVVIDPQRAAAVLPDGFELSAFTEVPQGDTDAGGSEDDPDGSAGSITDFDALEPGYQTIECELASLVDPKPWLQDEGVLSDGDQPVDVLARGDANVLAAAEQGDRIRIRNAKVNRDGDGLLQVELLDGTTSIDVLESDIGQQSPLDDHEPTTADSGADKPGESERIDNALKRWIGTKETEHEDGAPANRVVPAVAGDLDADPDAVEHRLEKLKERGEVYEPADGRLRRTQS